MRDSKYRFMILKVIMVLMLGAITARLFTMQIIEGDIYSRSAEARLSTSISSTAPRGDILDRYGRVLVTNETGYAVLMKYTTSDREKFNSNIRSVVEILNRTGNSSYGSLPITIESPYSFMFEDTNNNGSADDEMKRWFENNIHSDRLYYGMSAVDVLRVYADIYGVSGDINRADTRGIIGVRYDAERQGFSAANPVIIAEDINVDAVTEIKEFSDSLEGFSVTENYVRTYNYPGLATHILGRIGRISSEEYEKNSSKGYGMNDMIGKQGIERWAESYLRGVNGSSGTVAVVDGKEVEVSKQVNPIPGNYVMLTIDSELQKTLEDSLKNTVEAIGDDCNAGAAVVIEVNSGDVLAMGSYPTYDMSRFNEDYEMLVKNESNPMLNRAVSGLYSPGSTFKPVTAIAAIGTGNLAMGEQIICTGVYTAYEDYQPVCWIWSEARHTHGNQDVTLAIENSCNVFFYELGRRIGIDGLAEYAKKFGLGEYTGIELTEETLGHMASPEYKKQVVSNVIDQDWFGGDTLQAAIGQSYSLFTPVQLANYCATIANGGTRYKVNLIDSIRSSTDGSPVAVFEPQIEEQLNIDPATMRKIHDGMKKVVDEGSASSIFEGYPIQVGGKTGTAQLGKGANNAIFIAFAPFDDPQIAIAVVLEHGVRGTNAGRVARDVFDKYFFGSSTDIEVPTEEPWQMIR